MMAFTHTEAYGDKPIAPWLADHLTKYIKEKHGLEVRVTIIVDKMNPTAAAAIETPDQ